MQVPLNSQPATGYASTSGGSTIGGHQEGDGSGGGQQSRVTGGNNTPIPWQADVPWGQFFNTFQNLQTGSARTDLWAARQRYGLGMQDLGIDRAALARQIPLINQRWSLQKQRFGHDLRDIDFQRDRIRGMRDYTRYQHNRAQQELEGESAARGAITTLGHGRRQEDITQRRDDELAASLLQRQQLNLREKGIRVDKKEGRMLMREEKRKMRDGLKHLDVEAKRLGISLKEAKRRLGDALAQSSLGAFLSVAEMLQGLANADEETRRRILGMLQNRVT